MVLPAKHDYINECRPRRLHKLGVEEFNYATGKFMSYTSTALEKTEKLRKVHCFMLKHSTSSIALSTSYSNIYGMNYGGWKLTLHRFCHRIIA
jgi:hypothetical protein